MHVPTRSRDVPNAFRFVSNTFQDVPTRSRAILDFPPTHHSGFDCTIFTHVDHGGPAGGEQGARARAGDAGGRVDASGPVGHDKVLEAAELLGRVHDDRRALGREPVLVRVARDRGDAGHAEVDRRDREAAAGEIKKEGEGGRSGQGQEERARARGGEQEPAASQTPNPSAQAQNSAHVPSLLHEGDDEAAEAAVHVQANVVAAGNLGQRLDVVDGAVREVGRRANNLANRRRGQGWSEKVSGWEIRDADKDADKAIEERWRVEGEMKDEIKKQ